MSSLIPQLKRKFPRLDWHEPEHFKIGLDIAVCNVDTKHVLVVVEQDGEYLEGDGPFFVACLSETPLHETHGPLKGGPTKGDPVSAIQGLQKRVSLLARELILGALSGTGPGEVLGKV